LVPLTSIQQSFGLLVVYPKSPGKEFDTQLQSVNVNSSLVVVCPSTTAWADQEAAFQHITAYYNHLFGDAGHAYKTFSNKTPENIL